MYIRLAPPRKRGAAKSGLQAFATRQFLDIPVSVYNIIWAEIESCTFVLAACLSTYGPLVRTLASRV
jgi:hypothetical protein